MEIYVEFSRKIQIVNNKDFSFSSEVLRTLQSTLDWQLITGEFDTQNIFEEIRFNPLEFFTHPDKFMQCTSGKL